MIVPARPFPEIRSWTHNKNSVGSYFYRKDFIFFPRGRDALCAAMQAMEMPAGSGIIVPSYICASTIGPLKETGFKVHFIDIDADLQIPIDKLDNLIISTGAKVVLVVHYFGFPAYLGDLQSLCKTRNVKLVEDCCHNFLSLNGGGSPIGSEGDAAIFSMRKTLPITDGGALLLKSKVDNAESMKECFTAPRGRYYVISRLLELIFSRILRINIYSPIISKVKKIVRSIEIKKSNDSKTSNCIRCSEPSQQLQGYLRNKTYLSCTRHTVVGNYCILHDALLQLGYKPLFPSLPDGSVPQWAPFVVQGPHIVDWLRSRGVGASRWPWHEMPNEVREHPELYPNTHHLDKNIMLLPVHQSISKEHVKRMVELLAARINLTHSVPLRFD